MINRARNSGSGFNHRTSSIPFGLQAFNVDFVSTNNKVLERCNYAFLLDNSWPEVLESIKIVEKLGFSLVLLDWQIHNWTNGWCEMLDSFNNRQDFQWFWHFKFRFLWGWREIFAQHNIKSLWWDFVVIFAQHRLCLCVCSVKRGEC